MRPGTGNIVDRDPVHVAPIVDFLCVHLYPQGNNLDELELTLRAAAVDMPVAIEEVASYVDPAQTDQLLSHTVGSASGWFAFFDSRAIVATRNFLAGAIWWAASHLRPRGANVRRR
jgi:hypothetical protein